MRKIITGLVLLSISGTLWAGPRDAQWTRVEEAIQKGLPKTAITNLEPIIRGALRDKAYAEAVKAIGQRIVLESNIQGNKPEEKITRLQTEISKAPQEMVPILDALLAHWYWQYYQENRWRFLQRTATQNVPGADFTTWDLPRLFAEIDRQFQLALKPGPFLKATPIESWGDLLRKGTMPDAYRPTLYDFIAHEALEFYTSGEQAGAKPEQEFELLASSPILSSLDEFLAWRPGAEPGFSPVLRAIDLYQELLRFHLKDPTPQLALGDADLGRLGWGWNAATGEDKDSRYLAALDAFIGRYADFEISALAFHAKARVFQEEGDLVSAHQFAARGAQVFPGSPGGKLCRNLVAEIEGKSASISTERVWTSFVESGAGLPAGGDPSANRPQTRALITVRYRNIESVYFRAIRYDWAAFLERRHNRPESLSDSERRQIIAQTPALEWSQKLPPTTDYKEKVLLVEAPDDLQAGFYFIVASHDPKFDERENVVSLAPVWVTDLALVTRTRSGRIEGFVLGANSGEPIAGAEVSIWHLDSKGNRVTDPGLKTDENGTFGFKPEANRSYLFRARYAGHEIATPNDLWSYNYQPESENRPQAQTVFFTDRGIYRPGQTIRYKGICLWADQDKDDYQVLKGEALVVVLRDQNGKEVAREKVKSNDFGSFSGSFIAPRDRVTGQMSLQVEGRAQGTAWVRVEEYKRPKFQVTLEAPKTAARLNEKVVLKGHALAYTGAPVDAAPVRYRVVRQAQMPWWWGWYGHPWPGSQSQEIAHGKVTTAVDGSFEIEFVAKPDLKIAETNEPVFLYQINADVTDNAGETRSAEHRVRVGYTALEATLSASDWQSTARPIELRVQTRTLDQEPLVAEGRVLVYDLQAPSRPRPAPFAIYQEQGPNQPLLRAHYRTGTVETNSPDLSNPNNWPLGKVVGESGFTTDTNGTAQLSFKLGPGMYRAVIETQDRFGKKVTGKLPIQVLDPDAAHLGSPIPQLLAAPSWEVQPGEDFTALWGTGYKFGRAFIEIEHRHQMIQRFWTQPERTQQQIRLAINEALRGGFTLHVTQVREDRAYLQSRKVEVPWRNKELDLRWEHFVSKLEPNQKETWTLRIAKVEQSQGVAAKAAELVATLYDESLDSFMPFDWQHGFSVFHQDYSSMRPEFANQEVLFQYAFGGWANAYQQVEITYRSFPPDLTTMLQRYAFFERGRVGGIAQRQVLQKAQLGAFTTGLAAAPAAVANEAVLDAAGVAGGVASGTPAQSRGTESVSPRKNLNESAFFFPQLVANDDGEIRMTFTMPEALTKWHFLAFAHDTSLRSGFLQDHAVTAKDLMVQPNPPRFLREGDLVEFTVKVSNQSEKTQTGTVRLEFKDAVSGKSMDDALQVSAVRSGHSGSAAQTQKGTEQDFSIPAKESRGFAWRIHIPDGCGFLTYKAVGVTPTVSDGEEGFVPVLSRRILVTESLALPIRGPSTKKFEFTKLLKSGGSKTLQSQSLTVQMVSNPAWYAVLALPYLMEYPHECSEQVFNRLYANALARNIALSDPRVERVFEQWRNTPALDSPLEKNPELKAVALQETPWLREAESESQARKNVGILFDQNRLNDEIGRALEQLSQMQLSDGLWPWFPGGRGDDYISLYITTGFGRLRHLGVDLDVAPAMRALFRLDTWMQEEYDRIQSHTEPDKYVPSPTIALYLYGRSFFLKDRPVAPQHQKALSFFLQQSRKFWLKTNCRQTQGQLAIGLARFSAFTGGADATPSQIMQSIKERSVTSEELGMFWRETEYSWWWYRAPIETQALMIEAFDEVMHDQASVEDCKIWLLKQKQTQDWKTTKATADAVYALLLRGRNLLSSEALVQVKVGGMDLTPKAAPASGGRRTGQAAPNQAEAGTGFYEIRFDRKEIKPRMGDVTVRKEDEGVAWGSLHWQYLEDISKVTPYQGTPLKLTKTLFTKSSTNRGQVLQPIQGVVHVGDELVVRIELRVDRDMEYVHLRDQRGSGTEPVNVLSQYKYQDGLAYYESTRDTATDFFIDYLPKGTYVFEYSTRVQLRGRYQTGLAEIQCMYAPEFGGHSSSFELSVD